VLIVNNEALIFSLLLGSEIVESMPVYRGRNARVFRLTDRNGAVWCGKLYAPSLREGQDRLRTEWFAYSFLSKHWGAKVPRPMAYSPEEGAAIYEWIDGEPFAPNEPGIEDLDQALAFMNWVNSLRDSPEAMAAPAASEACFSGEDLLGNLTERIDRLLTVNEDGCEHEAMHDFVERHVQTACNSFAQSAREGYRGLSRGFGDDLPLAERLISPSDFGFHNALKTVTGIVWLDFEYFGWDDPAKTMADFLLHPAMDLATECKRRFWTGLLRHFDRCGDLAQRARLLYPLYGIKWCLIILNEFIPKDLDRRAFAGRIELCDCEVRRLQLSKAKHMLDTSIGHYERFPY